MSTSILVCDLPDFEVRSALSQKTLFKPSSAKVLAALLTHSPIRYVAEAFHLCLSHISQKALVWSVEIRVANDRLCPFSTAFEGPKTVSIVLCVPWEPALHPSIDLSHLVLSETKNCVS